MKKFVVTVAVLLFSLPTLAHRDGPNLEETLAWLQGAPLQGEVLGSQRKLLFNLWSGQVRPSDHCSVQINEYLNSAEKLELLGMEEFSLRDVDPKLEILRNLSDKNTTWVRAHITNYRFKVKMRVAKDAKDMTGNVVDFALDRDIAPGFMKAFSHAVTLCSGQPSDF